MSPDGLKTCPHCRAIVQSTICSICGRSTLEAAAPAPPAPRPRWTDAFEHHELRKAGFGILAVLVLAGAIAFVLTRDDAPPAANALPPPASTTTVDTKPATSDAPPSLVGGARPASGFVPGTPREVGEGLAPWENPPPIHFVTGALLDESLDFTTDISRVHTLLAALPEPLGLVALDPPEILTFRGPLDLELVETTQPFAARILVGADATPIGRLWLVASAGSEAGDAYLAEARARWGPESALEQFSPEVGLRLWQLIADETTAVWAGELDDDSLVLFHTAPAVDPAVLTDVLGDWRRTLS